MKEIKFAHIAPTSLVDVGIANSDFNMVLAHIADHNDKYCEAFKNSDNETLLDNGAFELGKPYSVDKMVEIGHRVGADILVLPDYPRRAYTKGWEDINHRIKVFKDAGFKTMFVPQSVDGDVEGFLTSMKGAVKHEDIDYIGLSIIGVPNAFSGAPGALSLGLRAAILEGFKLAGMDRLDKRFHMLGMLDDPIREIELAKPYAHMINSWDSSAAIWAGMHGRALGKHKFSKPVDFDAEGCTKQVGINMQRINDAKRN